MAADNNWVDAGAWKKPVFTGLRTREHHSRYVPTNPGCNVKDFENLKNDALMAGLDTTVTGVNSKWREDRVTNSVNTKAELDAFIAANPSGVCHVNVFGVIQINEQGGAYTIPANICVHPKAGCNFFIYANNRLTIHTIGHIPDFKWFDVSDAGSTIVITNCEYLNPIWAGATMTGLGVVDDRATFANVERSALVSGVKIVIDRPHLISSAITISKLGAVRTGKLIIGFNGYVTIGKFWSEDAYSTRFECSTLLRYVVFANQGLAYIPWFGVTPGVTSSDYGKAWTLCSKSQARVVYGPFGGYYTTTSAVGYGMQSQVHTCDPGTTVVLLGTTARSIFRRVCGWRLAITAPITNNGSGYVRVKFHAPLLELYATVVLQQSGVPGYNTTGTVTAVGHNYIDLDIAYVSDSTCTVDLMDGTTYATGMILKDYTFMMPQVTVPDTHFCIWAGVEYNYVTYYSGRGVSEFVIDNCVVLTNNASTPSLATGIMLGYATLTKIKDVRVDYCHIGIDIRASTCVHIVRGKLFHNDIQVNVWGVIGFYSSGLWQTMSQVAYLVQHDSDVFVVRDETSEHGGVIVFRGSRMTNFLIEGCTYADVAHRILEAYSTSEDHNIQGKIKNCLLGVSPDDDPGKRVTQEDAHHKKSSIYAECHSEDNLQFSAEDIGYFDENTGGILAVQDMVVARIGKGQRIPCQDKHIVRGQTHDLGTQINVVTALTPGTINAGSTYTLLTHVAHVDGIKWFIRHMNYTKSKSSHIRMEAEVIDDVDHIIEDVTLSHDDIGHITLEKTGLAALLDVSGMLVDISDSDTLDGGPYEVEAIDATHVLLRDSDYGEHTYQVTYLADYTLVPSTQTVQVILDLSRIDHEDPFWTLVGKDGENIRAYDDDDNELPLDIIDFQRDSSLYATGFRGRVAVLAEISHTQDTPIHLRTGRWSLSMPARDSTYGSDAVWQGYSFVLNNGKFYVDDFADYSAPEKMHGVKRLHNAAPSGYDPMMFTDQFNSAASLKPGFCLYRPYGQGYYGTTFGDRYNPGSNNFVFTTWFLAGTQGSAYTVLCSKWYIGAASGYGFVLTLTSAGVLQLTTSDNGVNANTSTWTLPNWNNGSYHHLLLIKTGTAAVYWDGVLLTMGGTAPYASIYASSHAFCLQSACTTSHDYWMPTTNPASVLYNPRFLITADSPVVDKFLIQRLSEMEVADGSLWKSVTPSALTDSQSGSITPKALRITMENTRPIGGDAEAIEAGNFQAIMEYNNIA